MKKNTRFILSFLIVVSTLLFSRTALAETLPSGFLIGDDSGFTAKSDGKYFIENNNIVPGGKFSKEIVIGNYSRDRDAIILNMMMNPDNEEHAPKITGSINLFEVINVKLTLDNQVIYDGLMDGSGKNNERNRNTALELGTYEVGVNSRLVADFTVSDELPKEMWRDVSAIDFYWVFYAQRESKPQPPVKPGPTKPKPGPTLPQTGEELALVLVGMIAGFIIILITIKFYQRKNLN